VFDDAVEFAHSPGDGHGKGVKINGDVGGGQVVTGDDEISVVFQGAVFQAIGESKTFLVEGQGQPVGIIDRHACGIYPGIQGIPQSFGNAVFPHQDSAARGVIHTSSAAGFHRFIG